MPGMTTHSRGKTMHIKLLETRKAPYVCGNDKLRQAASSIKELLVRELTSDEVAKLVRRTRNLDKLLREALTGEIATLVSGDKNFARELKRVLLRELSELVRNRENFNEELSKILMDEVAELIRNQESAEYKTENKSELVLAGDGRKHEHKENVVDHFRCTQTVTIKSPSWRRGWGMGGGRNKV